MDDKAIISLLFERSENALTAIQSKYGRLCSKIAGNILNNTSDAEECVNDTYLGVWNSIPPNRPDNLMAYVCRITRNLAIKRYHSNTAAKRNSHYDVALEELDECLASNTSPEEEVVAGELTRMIEGFLDGLKQTDRVIFMRRYYFSDSYEAIADMTGLSAKNVSVRLARVRSRLREYLTEGGYIQ